MLYVHASTTIVAHPQSSTDIIIYSDRCPHNKLHGSYIFIAIYGDSKVQLCPLLHHSEET